MEVAKSFKTKQKNQQSLIKGETVYIICKDDQYLYTWVGNCLEIYPIVVLNYLIIIHVFNMLKPRGTPSRSRSDSGEYMKKFIF